ncbi:MAG TPA: metallophosphoesterase [Flavobacterium sp.]|nr:metallophosphoesterase [Flavobacterium sp.]
MKRILLKLSKWSMLLGLSYFVITTLIFGHSDVDSEKGIYNFYWSGLNGLWREDKSFGFKMDEPVTTLLDGADGPYVFGNNVYNITENNQLQQQNLNSNKTITVKTTCAALPSFTVALKANHSVENYQYAMPSKLVAISDIEGNFNGFYSFLLANKVMDKKANWIFGNGHLVLNGDFFDRGEQVPQVLWLIYHLENQAEKQGGKVHYIIGNHEVMNMYGNASYNAFKYMEAAKLISKQPHWNVAIKHLYSDQSELGKWMRSKNIIEKIGGTVFVHGGLNKLHLDGHYSIKELNTIARKYFGTEPTEAIQDKRALPVLSSTNSPYWDRRLNYNWKIKLMYMFNAVAVEETTQEDLDSIIDYYQASRIVIGHSIADDITTGYNNKVIRIDIKHNDTMHSGGTKGLLIEDNLCYKIDDLGEKTKL